MKGCDDRKWVVHAIFLMILPLFAMGCGIKDAPVVPRSEKPPKVSDLRYRIIGDTLELTWKVPEKKNKRQSNLAGFRIYESKIPLSESECENCPLTFKAIGDIPVTDKDNVTLMTYSQTLESAHRYSFMIRGYSENDTVSEDSNDIHFVFE